MPVPIWTVTLAIALAQEREEKAALREHNNLVEMQLRNQHGMRELYENMRMLRHDISAHLTTIFGYAELEQYQKLKDYIGKLRCHRSYIINLHHMGRLMKDEVEIDNGDTLPVSKARWGDLNECFFKYYMKR